MEQLSYVGSPSGLMEYLNSINVCERCGRWEADVYKATDPETDKLYISSLCEVCYDDMNG